MWFTRERPQKSALAEALIESDHALSRSISRRDFLRGTVKISGAIVLARTLPELGRPAKKEKGVSWATLQNYLIGWREEIDTSNEKDDSGYDFQQGLLLDFEQRLSSATPNSIYYINNKVKLFFKNERGVIAAKGLPLYGIRQAPPEADVDVYFNAELADEGGVATYNQFSMFYPDQDGLWQAIAIKAGGMYGPTQPGTKLVGLAVAKNKEIGIKRGMTAAGSFTGTSITVQPDLNLKPLVVPEVAYYDTLKHAVREELLGTNYYPQALFSLDNALCS